MSRRWGLHHTCCTHRFHCYSLYCMETFQVTRDNQKMDWRAIEELYKREVQKLEYPDRSMDGLKGQWSRLNEAMQQMYLPQVNHDTFIPSHPDPHTFTTDSDQTSLFPNISMAQATTPDLGAALQSPNSNLHQDMAFPAEKDFIDELLRLSDSVPNVSQK